MHELIVGFEKKCLMHVIQVWVKVRVWGSTSVPCTIIPFSTMVSPLLGLVKVGLSCLSYLLSWCLYPYYLHCFLIVLKVQLVEIIIELVLGFCPRKKLVEVSLGSVGL